MSWRQVDPAYGSASAALDEHGRPIEEPVEDPAERVVAALLSEETLHAGQAEEEVWSDRTGAVVTFAGIVRNHDGGRAVDRLDYSAHPTAQARLREVAQEVADRHPAVRLWTAHRVGRLWVGDHALVAAAASAHRAEAFAACAELVEEIKAEVPIWKRQLFSTGESEWVGIS